MHDTNDISLPHLMVSWFKETGFDVSVKKEMLTDGCGFEVICNGFHPIPKIYTVGFDKVIVIGCPVVGEIIDPEAAAKGWLLASDPDSFLRDINGQFLLIRTNKENDSIILAGDRFNGIPLYWADLGNRFICSTLYFDLIKEIRKMKSLEFSGESMFEFIWLQRVMGDKTHDTISKFLLPACCLEVTQSGVSLTRFWRPDFKNKSKSSNAELGKEFTSLLLQSIKRLTSDGKRFGLFLSGGHDSRVLLSAFKNAPVCFTVGYSDNYEVQCARDAANAVNAEHHYIKLQDDNLIKYQDKMAQLCGGMFATDNALFMGIKESITPYADVLFHGHGLDYLFQGMYIPADTIDLFGRPTFFRRLRKFKGDFISSFLTQISFREREISLLDYVLQEHREYIEQWLKNSIQKVLDDGDECCETNYDRWEYLVIHSLGRHYSRPNIESTMTLCEQRTACFDNDLFDFYCRLPTKKRLNAQMMRYALKHLHPKLATISTGNYGLPAGASPFFKTLLLIIRKIRRHITGNSSLHAPSAVDRTWPDRDDYLRSHEVYKKRALDALNSEKLHKAMPFMDWKKINSDFNHKLSNPKYGGAKFLVSLMSLDRFLRQVD